MAINFVKFNLVVSQPKTLRTPGLKKSVMAVRKENMSSRLLVYLKLFNVLNILRSYLAEKPDGRGFRNYLNN